MAKWAVLYTSILSMTTGTWYWYCYTSSIAEAFHISGKSIRFDRDSNFRTTFQSFPFGNAQPLTNECRSRGEPSAHRAGVVDVPPSIWSNDTSKVATNEEKSSQELQWRTYGANDVNMRRINSVESHESNQQPRCGELWLCCCCWWWWQSVPTGGGEAAPKHDAATKMYWTSQQLPDRNFYMERKGRGCCYSLRSRRALHVCGARHRVWRVLCASTRVHCGGCWHLGRRWWVCFLFFFI